MEGKLFSKRKEDFVCEVCGKKVHGKGYTNHCPFCLCSKHVDINPGDRASPCGGIMRPVRVEKKGEGFVIVHKCEVCGFERKNKSAPEDDFAKILEVCRQSAMA